jgi:hypothetical protein
MTFGAFISRVSGALIAGSLAFTLIFAAVYAAEDQRKVTVMSFGLFGSQGVFRREATGAAEIVANRFGADQVVVRFNTKTGGDATVEALAATLQVEAKKMNGDRDILFLILTSHGSQEGLAVNAGPSAETLKPSNLAVMLKRTGIGDRHFGLLFRRLYTSHRRCGYTGDHCGGCQPFIVWLRGQSQVDVFR